MLDAHGTGWNQQRVGGSAVAASLGCSTWHFAACTGKQRRRRSDVPSAWLVIEARDEGEVHAVPQSLPLLAEEMLEVTKVIPLRPCHGFGPGT